MATMIPIAIVGARGPEPAGQHDREAHAGEVRHDKMVGTAHIGLRFYAAQQNGGIMSRITLILAIGLALPTTVQAQWTGPGAGGSYGPSVTPSVTPYQAPPPNSSYSAGPQPPSNGYATRAPDAANCGTPDEPKPCPSMPKRAMHDRPPNRE